MTFISVADAVERTGKGQTTIYRLCRKHEHTKHIRREDKKFLIDEEFLSKHFPGAESRQPEENRKPEPLNNSGSPDYSEKEKPAALPAPHRQELIDLFIDELLNEKRYYRQLLEKKDEQLERKDQIISRLQERQKELYFLLNHQTSLLEKTRQPEPVESPPSPALKPKETESFRKEEVRADPKPPKKKMQMEGAAVPEVVYYVLAFIGFLLLLAIVYVDEIRALTE